MSNYPNFSMIGNEGVAPAPIGDNAITQGIGFPLRSVSQAGGDTPYPGPQPVLFAESQSTQSPVTTGPANAIQVEFGPAQGVVTDSVMIDGLGNITFNETGVYDLVATFYISREVPPEVADFVIRGLVNGVQFGNPVVIHMNDDENTHIQQLTVTAGFTAGDVMTIECMRDSTGFDDGYLEAVVTSGWGTSPSAVIRLTKF